MPLKRLLGEKDIMTDLRRINTGAGAGAGSVGQHSLLGPRHTDTVITHPSEGALIVGNVSPQWSALLHPAAAGYAMVTDATTWTIDQTPTWTGDHTWDDGSGNSPALVLIPENDDEFYILAYNNATPGDGDLAIRLAATDHDSELFISDSAWAASVSFSANSRMTFWKSSFGEIRGAGTGYQFRLTAGSDYTEGAYMSFYGIATGANQGNIVLNANTAGAGGSVLVYQYDGAAAWALNTIFHRSGDVGMGPGVWTPSAQLHVDQASAAGAQPALWLNQADVSEQHIVASIGGADVDFPALLQLDVTGAPTLWWDESESRLIWDEHLGLSAGDLHFASTYGVYHADAVQWDILYHNGTKFIPGALSVLPGGTPIPGARGHIIRGEAGPVWASYNAATAGAVLIGDGTDIISDTTPTLVGDLTLDDGAGNSPAVAFVGGSNDDAAYIYLDNDAVAGNSDLTMALCADDGDSVFRIRNASLNTVALIDALGNMELSEYISHYGDSNTYIRFQDDNLTLEVGGVTFLNLVEAGTDYIDVGAQILLNGFLLTLDVDDDTYIYSPSDDVVVLAMAGAAGEFRINVNGAQDFTFTANSFNVLAGSNIDMGEDSWIGTASNDLRIVFDASSGYLTAALGDAAGADEFRVIDSGGNPQATIDSDGNADFNGHLSIGAAASYQATQVVSIDEVSTSVSAATNVYGVGALLQAEPAAATQSSFQAFHGLVRLDTAQAQTAGQFAGVTGRAEINNGIAGTILDGMGGSFYVDAEDGVMTVGSGAQIWTPNVDAGSVGTGRGVWIRAGTKGAGTITTLYGLYIDDVAAGGTNYSIYTAGGANYFGAYSKIHQQGAALAVEVLALEQNDIDKSFVNYIGTSAANQTRSISTVNGDGVVEGPRNYSSTAGWAFQGMVRIEVNNTEYWMPYYSADTS